MVNGTFLDLTEAMEKQGLSREEDFYTAVLDAGQWEGRQYILPLGFSVPLMVSATDVLNASSFDLQRAMYSMDSLLTELLRIHEEQSILVLTSIDPLDVLAQPVLDYEAHQVRLDTSAVRRALELEKIFRTGSISWEAQGVPFDNRKDQVLQQFEAGTPFAVLYETDISMNLLRRCEALATSAAMPWETGTHSTRMRWKICCSIWSAKNVSLPQLMQTTTRYRYAGDAFRLAWKHSINSAYTMLPGKNSPMKISRNGSGDTVSSLDRPAWISWPLSAIR